MHSEKLPKGNGHFHTAERISQPGSLFGTQIQIFIFLHHKTAGFSSFDCGRERIFYLEMSIETTPPKLFCTLKAGQEKWPIFNHVVLVLLLSDKVQNICSVQLVI